MFSLDPGGRSFGSAGAFSLTNAETLSSYWNPAGLGYLRSRYVGLSYMSMPSSRTMLGGTYYFPVRNSSATRGSSRIGHFGVTYPLARGTLGVSYTVGGYVDDLATGTLDIDTFDSTIIGYQETRKAQTEFVNIGYGTTLAGDSLAVGVSATLAQTSVSYSETGMATNGGWQPISLSGRGSGLGVTAGVQYVPRRLPNASLAASYRSPIKLSIGGNAGSLLDEIPGRFMVGGAYRLDNMRGRDDYLVLGLQFEQYSASGKDNYKFQRDSQSGFALGAEYHYSLGPSGTIPIRLGYRNSGSGGNDYGSRTAITYGIGFQPGDRQFTVDFGWANVRGGRTDFALTVSYRFK